MSVHEEPSDTDPAHGEEREPVAGDRIRDALRRMRGRRRASDDRAARAPKPPDRPSVLRALESDAQSRPGATVSGAAAGAGGPAPESAKYHLDEEIGAGGVGVVYRGVDAYLGREVALKFLNDRYRDNPSIVARFLEEAQIGGQLQHPGIVPVHDIGIVDGQLFFAMKMVHGRALSALLADRESAVTERGRRLKIFEAVCQTVAYAHARQVIHRDLKPDNVMVGKFGEVQVVDWGMAKVLGSARRDSGADVETVRSSAKSNAAAHSVAGSIMGTPDYMPPEQARGDIEAMDERSDVFALGAMLLEILTGRPPYGGASLDDRIGLARRCELDEARARLARCGADAELVKLCDDCLQAEAEARPRSAGEVAERISLYLTSVERRAEEARIEAARSQVKAEEERKARRLTAGLAAAVVLIVVVVAGGWTWLSWQAEAKRRSTDAEILTRLESAATARGRDDWVAAVAAVDSARALAATGDGSEAVAARTAREHASIRSAAAAARRAEDLARSNRLLLQALEEVRYPDTSKAPRHEWAQLADDYHAAFRAAGLNLLDGTVTAAVEAAGSRGISIDIASAVEKWAFACFRARQNEPQRRLIEIANGLDPHADRAALRSAMFRFDLVRARSLLERLDSMEPYEWVPVWHSVGQLLEFQLRKMANTGSRTTYLELCRSAHRRDPRRFDLTLILAFALQNHEPPLLQEAARYYEAALTMRPESVEVRHQYGRLLEYQLDEPQRAVELFREALSRRSDDGHLWWHLGLAHKKLGDLEAAEEAFQKAVRLSKDDLKARVSLAQSLWQNRKLKAAERLAREVLARDEDNGPAWGVLGTTLRTQRRDAEAIRAFEESLRRDPEPATYHNYGLALGHLGQYENAIRAFRDALRLDPDYASARCNLGLALEKLGRKDEALATYREVVARAPNFTLAWSNLGVLLMNTEQFAEAARCLLRARELGSTIANAGIIAYVLRMHGEELGKLGKVAAQRRAYARSDELLTDDADVQHAYGMMFYHRGRNDIAFDAIRRAAGLAPKVAVYQYDLGNILNRFGRTEKALAAFQEAVELDPDHAEAWCNLGSVLGRLGRDVEALAAYEKGHRLGSSRKNWPYPSDKWVEAARRKAAGKQRKR